MEEQTKKMIMLVIAALAVVALVFGIIFYFRGSTTDEAPALQEQAAVPVQQETSEPAPVVEEPIQPVVQQNPPSDSKDAQLKRFCIDFVARFGTYSTDAQSENLKQLLPSMSGTLKTWAQGIIASATVGAEKFSGVTTKALSAKIISQSGGSAVVEVSTQRTFTEGNATRVTYETATVSLTNNGSWYVESVKWALRPE